MLFDLLFKIFLLLMPFFASSVEADELERGGAPAVMGQMTLCHFDEKRQRPLVMDVWYAPASLGPMHSDKNWVEPNVILQAPLKDPQAKHPLILMSHGYGGERKDLIWMAQELTKQGYIVVSLDHFGGTWKERLPESYVKLWDRPRDISVALDYLLETSSLSQSIDDTKIGFMGFSMGGMTGIWLAGGQIDHIESPSWEAFDAEGIDPAVLDHIDLLEGTYTYFDQRIRAYFLLAPRAFDFNEKSLKSIESPLFIVYGENDTVLPAKRNAEYLFSQTPSAQKFCFDGDVGHFVFLRSASERGKEVLPQAIVQDSEGVMRESIHKHTQHLASTFFAKELKAQ